jgi:hypothetical protein
VNANFAIPSERRALLTPADQLLARETAAARFAANRARQVENRKIGKQDNWATDLNGIAGEIAFCRLACLAPDLATDHWPGYDAMLPWGYRVDVKTTEYHFGHLLAVRTKVHTAVPEVYALMIVRWPIVEYAGWIEAVALLQPTRLRVMKPGYPPTYAMAQAELHRDLVWEASG